MSEHTPPPGARTGKAVEVELAVASVVGSGLFICSVSLAAVIFVRPVEIVDRVAFVSPSHGVPVPWS